MLSVVRQGLAQPSRLAYRRYATASVASTGHGATFEPSLTIPAVQDPVASLPGPSDVNSHILPVYIPLSSLIRPAKGQNPSQQLAELDPTVFSHPVRRDILHLCVVHHLDSLRQGSANTKTRAEVRGSGRKVRPQKGSGMARLGDGQSPMLVGGGVAFGPKPRDFSTKLPRKVVQMGMRVALSARVKEHGLRVVESLEWPGQKTKEMARRLTELGWEKTLFVTGKDTVPTGLGRSSSNLHKVETKTVNELNVYDLVKWPQIVLDLEAVDLIERKLSKSRKEGPSVAL